eukprot:2396295-Alexandrium_andersonii.AAC.1
MGREPAWPVLRTVRRGEPLEGPLRTEHSLERRHVAVRVAPLTTVMVVQNAEDHLAQGALDAHLIQGFLKELRNALRR